MKNYWQHKEYVKQKSAEASKAYRDIAPLPKVEDEQRKADCKTNFKLFCESYFSNRFTLAWSDDHLAVIERLQAVTLDGGLYAIAMARGSGKTSLCETAVIWSLLYGHHRFVMLVASDEKAAESNLENIKRELEYNEQLAADFPEVCYPIARLEGMPNRTAGQLHEGERTCIRWTAKELSLPVIDGSPASAAIVRVAGITGRIRGAKTTSPADGSSLRPSLVLIDDPSTSESARSAAQSKQRLDVINGDILGLAGPGQKISALCTCTVIYQNDLADELLNVTRHPDWQGHRCKLVYKWPSNKQLWEQYAEIRSTGLQNGDGIKAATEFYRSNRQAMDEGAIVAWKERYNDDELSALQHAWNLRLRDEAAFAAEYQKEPFSSAGEIDNLPTVEQLERHCNHLPRWRVPLQCHKLVAFIDVQQRALYYSVLAFADNFHAAVVDYGCYPDQKRSYFTLNDISRTLARVRKGVSVEQQIYFGLDQLTQQLLGRCYQREDDSQELFISRCIIDANWQTETVKQFCRESKYKSLLLPSHARGITPDRRPLNEYVKKQGDRVGWNWRIAKGAKHVLYDANSYKTFLINRRAITSDQQGSLTFHKGKHRMLAEHLLAEYPVPTTANGRTVNLWKLRPNRDNHLLDCLVGCLVGASLEGATTIGHQPSNRKPATRRRVKVTF